MTKNNESEENLYIQWIINNDVDPGDVKDFAPRDTMKAKLLIDKRVKQQKRKNSRNTDD